MPTQTQDNPQTKMEERKLEDSDLLELLRQDHEWGKAEKEARAKRKPIKDKIKSSLDAKSLDPGVVYRIGQFTIKKTENEGGKEVHFVTSPKTTYRIRDTSAG